jgi:hypothetical protein
MKIGEKKCNIERKEIKRKIIGERERERERERSRRSQNNKIK